MRLRWAFTLFAIAVVVAAGASACVKSQPATESPPSPTAASAVIPSEPTALPACDLPPIVAPTAPAIIPRYVELDPVTNLHMTGTPPKEPIDLATYRLKISGKVNNPVELTFDQIRCLPKVQASPLLVCPGFFEDQANWAGTPIKGVLALAGIQEGATAVKFIADSDKYQATLPLERALQEQNLIAYEWEGQPLPRYHGFPLRLVLPDMEGNQWVKWITEIVVK